MDRLDKHTKMKWEPQDCGGFSVHGGGKRDGIWSRWMLERCTAECQGNQSRLPGGSVAAIAGA